MAFATTTIPNSSKNYAEILLTSIQKNYSMSATWCNSAIASPGFSSWSCLFLRSKEIPSNANLLPENLPQESAGFADSYVLDVSVAEWA